MELEKPRSLFQGCTEDDCHHILQTGFSRRLETVLLCDVLMMRIIFKLLVVRSIVPTDFELIARGEPLAVVALQLTTTPLFGNSQVGPVVQVHD